MDHRFLTRRNEIRDLTHASSLVAIIDSINSASQEDIEHILWREDPHITDPDLRERVLMHSSHLGLLVRMIEDVAVRHSVCQTGDLVNSLDSAWRARLNGADPIDVPTMSTLTTVNSALCTALGELTDIEGCDAGSTSPSDYSDSESCSSEDEHECEDEEEEEEEDEEEEEEEPEPPPVRRRRR